MAMKSKDVIKAELKSKLGTALASNNSDELVTALTDFAAGIQEDVVSDFKAYQATNDVNILAKRGIRQLTDKENKFYGAVIKAAGTGDIKMAFTGLDTAFPQTVIDAVIEDIRKGHPLLSEITFRNTSTLTKILVNKKGIQLATWGALGSKITTELEGAIGNINLTKSKLTAFLPISKDMLEAGPQWVDAYVRETLAEANAAALEKAIVTGTGKDQPIGMDRSVADDVTVTAGVYPQKTKVVVTSLDPASYGVIAEKLATAPNGGYRPVPEILMIVNPSDYFLKVMPATTVLRPDGTYASDVLPYPTKIIQSASMEKDSAIFGLARAW